MKSSYSFFALLAALILVSCHESSHIPIPEVDKEEESFAIHTLMDDWHHAAAVADDETFFGTMSEKGIYLGTDKTERWERDELRTWAKKAFERDTAWAFTSNDREIYFSADGRTAWFEELLDTWMGPCRGSGVLTLNNGEWKLDHYNLAMLIDNDDVNAVLETIRLRDEQPDSLPDSQ